MTVTVLPILHTPFNILAATDGEDTIIFYYYYSHFKRREKQSKEKLGNLSISKQLINGTGISIPAV